jgi:hypothetical protein
MLSPTPHDLFLHSGQLTLLPLRGEVLAGCWWLTLVILVTQEAEIRRISEASQTILKKPQHKKGLVEWLKR